MIKYNQTEFKEGLEVMLETIVEDKNQYLITKQGIGIAVVMSYPEFCDIRDSIKALPDIISQAFDKLIGTDEKGVWQELDWQCPSCGERRIQGLVSEKPHRRWEKTKCSSCGFEQGME